MRRVAEDLPHERAHDLQVRVIPADMDIGVRQIVRRAAPPILRVRRNEIVIPYRRRLPVLGPHRAVEIEAVQPRSSPVQHLASVRLVHRRRCAWQVQV